MEKKEDVSWVIGRYQTRTDGEQCIQSWNGYNSLMSDGKDSRPLTKSFILPLIRAPAHNHSTLFHVLKLSQDINTFVVDDEESRTVVTLDMGLYPSALKVQQNNPVFNKIIIRIGEMHTVICTLRAIGAFVENSGLDDAWVQSELYSSTTVRQILEGRHMKRAIHAHIVTSEALLNLMIEAFVEIAGDINIETLQNTASKLNKACQSENPQSVQSSANDLEKFWKDQIEYSVKEFVKARGNPIVKAMMQYLRMVATMLDFIRASREGNWALHLSSLERLCNYFFAMDRLKYAQFGPLYLQEMKQLKGTLVWNQMEQGNFCVKKTKVAFTSLGVDHALEQGNKEIKSVGGVIGITQNPKTLTKHFLIAPEMKILAKEADELLSGHSDTSDSSPSLKHHDVSSSMTKNTEKNLMKLINTLKEYGNPFKEDNEALTNIMTKAIINEPIDDITDMEERGRALHKKYVDERLKEGGSKRLWDKMGRANLKKWSSSAMCVTVRVGKKDMEIRENRSLFAKMAIVARSRPEVNMEEAVSTYEFSAVCRALFNTDGSLLDSYKSKLLSPLKGMVENTETAQELPNILIVDAMALLYPVIQRAMTCQEVGRALVHRIESIAPNNVSEIHIIFDRYRERSVKNNERDKRHKTSKQQQVTQYICTEKTKIMNPQNFLSNSTNKRNLTEYLHSYLAAHYSSPHECQKKHVIVSSSCDVVSNRMNDMSKIKNTHEEADTILILHCSEVHQRIPNARIAIYSIDTDVLVLSIRFNQDMGQYPLLYMGRESVRVADIASALGQQRCLALPGFHALTGCDSTSRFHGTTKATWLKLFLDADNDILDALIDLSSPRCLTKATISTLTRFVCSAYTKKQSSDIGKLRWEMFLKNQAESEKLPPTYEALYQHLLRAQLQANTWANSTMNQPLDLDPEKQGWKLENDCYAPVVTNLKPAPDAVLELIKCGCSPGKCKDNRCQCRKVGSGLVCTELCGCCGDCENTEILGDINEESND